MTKPKPRGRQGGRKPRYLLPGEQIMMQDIKLRLRSDIVEELSARAAQAGQSRDEYVMRLLCPGLMDDIDRQRECSNLCQIRGLGGRSAQT